MLADIAARLATAEDAEGIAVLSRDLIEQGLPWRWRPARILKAMRQPNVNVAVVGPKGAPVAFGIMEYQEEDAHLLLFAVAEEHQRKGLGSGLLVWLEEVARAAGARKIEVEARRQNEAARCFYNEHGYHEWAVERGMYRPTVDGVHLEKWLRPASSESRSDA